MNPLLREQRIKRIKENIHTIGILFISGLFMFYIEDMLPIWFPNATFQSIFLGLLCIILVGTAINYMIQREISS